MKCNVLVIDDEIAIRRKSYSTFLAKVDDELRSIELSLDFAESMPHVRQLLNKNHYEVVLLDLVLSENDWETDDHRRICELLPADSQIVSVSIDYNEIRNVPLNESIQKLEKLFFLFFFDLERQSSPHFKRSVDIVTEVAFRALGVRDVVTVEPNDPIRILHLSDLQFGGFEADALVTHYDRFVEEIKRTWGASGPDIVAITGDVAERALPSEYKEAAAWLSSFLGGFGWSVPDRRVLVVPGNHDVNLSLATSSSLALSSSPDRGPNSLMEIVPIGEADFSDFALEPYRRFCRLVTDARLEPHGNDSAYGWVCKAFRHLGLVFYGINTASPILSNSFPGRSPNLEMVRNVIVAACDYAEAGDVVCGLWHHSPVDSEEDGGIKGAKQGILPIVKLIADRGRYPVLLSGHAHARLLTSVDAGNLPTPIPHSRAPTVTKRHEKHPDQLRGMNLIRIDRDNGVPNQVSFQTLEINGLDVVASDPKPYPVKLRK